MDSKPRIGAKDMCTLLGITPSSIRLYEQYLDEPRYDISDSGYRQFDSASFVQLYDMRFLSKCGISVQEAAQACQTTSHPAKMKVYEQGEQELRAKRDYYTAALQQLNETKSLFLKIQTLKGSFEYIDRPAFWYLECEENGKILDNPDGKRLIKQWVDAMPVVYFIHRVSSEIPFGKEWSYRIGMAVPDRHSHLVDTNHERVRFVPTQTCLATTVPDEGSESTRSSGFDFSKKVLGKGLRFIEEEGLRVSGEIFSRLITSNICLDDKARLDKIICDYYYATFPVT